MVQPIAPMFKWEDGKLRSPAEVAREQKIAEALMTAKPQAQGFWGALGQIGSAASGSLLDSRADASAQQGQEAASALFSGLGSGASTDSIAQALMNPAAAWATPGQSGVAEALMNNNLRQEDPGYQMDLLYKQAQIDKMNQEASGVIGGSSAPSNVQEWQYYSQLSPEEQAQYLTMKRSNSPLNIGTGFVTQNPAMPGTTMGAPIAINNQEAAFDTALGGAQGATAAENIANLPTAIATAERGIQNITDLENDPNLWSAVGALGVLPAVPGTPQAGVVTRIQQLQGGAFLEAYNSLKGGGQITEVEGLKAEQAIARLNRAQNEQDFRQALKELKEVIQAGADRARQKAGQSAPTPTGVTSPPSGVIDAGNGITIRRLP